MRFTPIVALAGVAAVQAASSGSVVSSSKPSATVSASGSYSKSASGSGSHHHSKSSKASETTTGKGVGPTTSTLTAPHGETTTASGEYGTWVTEWETVVETIFICPTDSSTWTFPTAHTSASTETVVVVPPPTSTAATSSKTHYPYSSGSSVSHKVSGTSKTLVSTSSPSATTCPTTLTNGAYEYPHLIVPVDSSKPTTALGTSYNGTITPTVSSIFDFDIPASDAGKTCSLVFLLPLKKDLETSSYSFNNEGGIKVQQLASAATQDTTFANQPAAVGAATTISSVVAGNSYVVSTGPCAAGQRVAYEFSSVGGLDLEFFQDYNPSPLGAYITTC